MTQLAKLFQKFVEGRPLRFTELQRLMEAFGWRLDRIAGSHHIYRHPAVPRSMPITPDKGNARPYQLRQVRDIIELHHLTLEDR